MINLCIPPSLIMSDKWNNYKTHLYDSWYNEAVLRICLLSAFTCVVCICGLVGNGAVIWLLGFRIKRNPFTIYILNLAVADFGVLISSISMAVTTIVDMHLFVTKQIPNHFYRYLLDVYYVSAFLSFFFYSTSQFLLTAISIDRCVSVLFPLWYRCRRPEKLSTVLCVLIWLLTLVIHGICLSLQFTGDFVDFRQLFFGILVNVVVCLPLTTVSTLFLFFKFCIKPQQRQRGKLLMAILLTLFFFLIFAFPLNIIYLIIFSPDSSFVGRLNVRCYNGPEYGLLCATLNSFVNPLLYFLVGRKKRGLCEENLKLILQRVFTEEKEACREEPGTQLSDPQKPVLAMSISHANIR